MAINDKPAGSQSGDSGTTTSGHHHHERTLAANHLVIPHVDVSAEAPPAYGNHVDHFRFSQPGLDAGAAVTGDGRVNININQKNRRLAELLAPVVESQADFPEGLPPAYSPSSVQGQAGQKPPPKLNVVVQIVGSRGDVQPFVALGRVLKEDYGHRVRIATHPTFQGFVEENGLDFFSIGGDPAELMAFMVKHPGLMPGLDALKSGEIRKRREGVQQMLLGCWRSCIEAGNGLGPPPQPADEPWDPAAIMPEDGSEEPFVADAIIANPPSFAHIHIAEKLGIPLHMMFTMPWSPTRAFPHPLANVQSTNADDVMTNYLTYRLVEMMTWQGLGDVINRFREKALDLPPLEMIWAPGLLQRLKISYTYCWSPALIPKPKDWGPHIDVAGFYFLDLASSYVPDPTLAAFLEAGPPPIYIGFGSIVVDDPNAMTRMILDAIHLAGVRALVSKGWGGLGADAVGLPEDVFMLGNVPHDWLFDKVSCVVHHGGAGTTAAGIKAGKPTIVVPFFGDQPFWGAMIARAKAGPDPIPHATLTAENLAEAIKFCLRPETQQQAKDLGEKIREERGAEAGANSFHKQLNVDALRCSVAPSRAAAWRVRRSNVRLSPLAAAVLVDNGLMAYSDLKLHRPCEHFTEGQPPEPITAGASAIMADLSSIGMSLFADTPRDMFRSRRRTELKPLMDRDDTERSTNESGGIIEAEGTGSVKGTASQGLPVTSSASSEARPNDRESSVSPSLQSETPKRRPSSTSRDTYERTMSTLDATVVAGKGVSRAVVTGVKSPMNFCLGLAKGFRNLPKLYNDDTVREVEKVTDFSSGVKVAGKELGLGFYDGVSGLVTQPMRGVQKDGVGGFVKGFGKGIGGLIAKPAAGVWGLPAYLMQGAYAEVNKFFSRSAQNYVMTSRVVEGGLDLGKASEGEKADMIRRWNTDVKDDLKSYYAWKKKESVAGKAASSAPPRSGDRRGEANWVKRLSDAHFQRQAASSSSLASADQQYEEAIRASVRETSRGNAEEDAVIETAIRGSVNAARQYGKLPEAVTETNDKAANIFDDAEYEITDEEYQELIARAMRESIASHGEYALPQDFGISELDAMHADSQVARETVPALPPRRWLVEEDEDMRRAIEESRETVPGPPVGEDDDEDLQRAIAASRDEMERVRSGRTEEDIVMEYVKRQSLAEEEFRRRMGREGDDDEELKRAIEESLRMSGNGSGPSGYLR